MDTTFYDEFVVAAAPLVEKLNASQAKVRTILYATDFGVVGDGSHNDGPGMRAAIQRAKDLGGASIIVPAGTIMLDDPKDGGVYALSISSAENIYIRGQGVGATTLKVFNGANVGVFGLYALSYFGLSDMTLDGNNLNQTLSARHGIKGSNKVDHAYFRNLRVLNACGYAIAFQADAGDDSEFESLFFDTIELENPNNDHIDIKNRSSRNRSIFFSNITIKEMHGGRIGLDIRGRATVNNLQVYCSKTMDATNCVGFRFRQNSPEPPPLVDTEGAQYDSLSNFIMDMAGGVGSVGVVVQIQRDCHISNGHVINAYDGILIAPGSSDATIVGVGASDCTNYGFNDQGVNSAFVACRSVGNAIAVLEQPTTVSRACSWPDRFAPGTVAAPSMTFSGDATSGWYQQAAGAWGYASGGALRVRFDAVGVSLANPTITFANSGSLRLQAGSTFAQSVSSITNSESKVRSLENPTGVAMTEVISGNSVIVRNSAGLEVYRISPFGNIFSTGIAPGPDNTLPLGSTGNRFSSIYGTQFRPGNGTPIWTSGTGSPEGVLAAVAGSMFTRTDGGTGTTLYVKETASGATGWGAK